MFGVLGQLAGLTVGHAEMGKMAACFVGLRI